jgi:hypothetical protein
LNARDAIPNTAKEVCYQIRLDLDGVAMLSVRRAGSGGERKSYHMVMVQPPGKTVEIIGEVLLRLRKVGNKVRWWGGVNERWLVRGFEYGVLVELTWHARFLGVAAGAW